MAIVRSLIGASGEGSLLLQPSALINVVLARVTSVPRAGDKLSTAFPPRVTRQGWVTLVEDMAATDPTLTFDAARDLLFLNFQHNKWVYSSQRTKQMNYFLYTGVVADFWLIS